MNKFSSLLGFLLAPFFLLCVLYSTAVDAEQKQKIRFFDLPGQPLQTGLIEFALQANITIIAKNEMITGHRTTPVVGPHTTRNALSLLLTNSPLTHHYNEASDLYLIQEKKQSVNLPDLPDKVNEFEIDELLVTGLSYPFRYNTVTNTQLHGSVPYFDSARFLNVLPRELISDQQPTDLADLLKHVSGITPGDGYTDSNDDIFIRGFRRHAIYVDGFRMAESTGTKILPDNIERVEVLKGPSTLHYGQAEPGGIVNVVRKKPKDYTFTHMSVGAGSEGRQKISLDVNNQLPVLNDANFRVVLSGQEQDKSNELKDVERQLASFSIDWQLNGDTSAVATYDYNHANQTQNRDIQLLYPVGDQYLNATLGNLSNQYRPDFDGVSHLFNVEFNHYLTADWLLKAEYFLHDESRTGIRTTAETTLGTDLLIKESELTNLFAVFIPAGQVVIPTKYSNGRYSIGNIRSLYDEASEETTYSFKTDLEGSLELGSTTHNLTFGADWQEREIYKTYTAEVRNLFSGRTWTQSAWDNALPGVAEVLFQRDHPLGNLEFDEKYLSYRDLGIFFFDNLEISEKWAASIGTRYASISGEFIDITDWEVVELKDYNNFASQIGLVHKPTENNSLYFSYSEAMRANYHVDKLGSTIVDPELSSQIEVGAKILSEDGRSMTSFGVFQMEKENIAQLKVVPDEYNDGRIVLSISSQTVQGFDFDFTAQVSNKLNVVGSAAFLNARISDGIDEGNTPMLVSDSNASLFAHYEFNAHVDINAGLEYVGDRYGDDANTYKIASYVALDLGFTSKTQIFGTDTFVSVNVKNATDEAYYTAVQNGVSQNEADGRTVVGTLKVEF